MSRPAIVRFIVLVPLLFIVLGFGFAQRSTSTQSEDRYGRIEGIVVTKEGMPVAGATVYIFQNGGSPMNTSDETGKFKFTGVAVGKHLILAYKESDGFPNPVWTFYSEALGSPKFPVADVRENQTVTVIVRLGPRASRLLINLIDAKTKRMIMDAAVAMNHVGKPKTLLRAGPNQLNGSFNINLLVPPHVPINLEVSAQGYRSWRYKGNGPSPGALRLEPDSERRITVQLQPATRAYRD